MNENYGKYALLLNDDDRLPFELRIYTDKPPSIRKFNALGPLPLHYVEIPLERTLSWDRVKKGRRVRFILHDELHRIQKIAQNPNSEIAPLPRTFSDIKVDIKKYERFRALQGTLPGREAEILELVWFYCDHEMSSIYASRSSRPRVLFGNSMPPETIQEWAETLWDRMQNEGDLKNAISRTDEITREDLLREFHLLQKHF